MAITLVAMCFFSRAQTRSLHIELNHLVGDRILKLDSSTYQNFLGQAYQVSKFKYYLGHFCLKNSEGKDFRSNDYFLVDEENPESKHILLRDVPDLEYDAIEFNVGVDSIDNCSGAQSGALDPVNAMFWAWNTGYIFLKLEGNSSYSNAPGHLFEYHIGGYKQPANCIRKVRLTLGQTTSTVKLNVDLAEILKTPNVIDFSLLPAVSDSKNARPLADNYQDMFSLKKTP